MQKRSDPLKTLFQDDMRELEGHIVGRVKFSPATLRKPSASMLKPTAVLNCQSAVSCISLNKDEDFLVSGSSDGIVRKWRLADK